MRPLLCLLALGLSARLLAADFTVHEWGTFTSVVGSDGRPLTGLEVEEERVPPFVHSFAGFAPFNKGWDRPVAGVTIKMETPVLYFYAAEPLSVRVAVGFRGGSISQWYPERSSGEQMSAPPAAERATLKPVDFSQPRTGSAIWKVDVLAHDTPLAINANRSWETPQWPRARVASANRVRNAQGEVEGFIFYRGLGNFPLPLTATAAPNGTLTLANHGAHEIPFVWIYEKKDERSAARSWLGSLPAGESRVAAELQTQDVPFAAALTNAGLSAEEAHALMDTWRESYFDRPGLRVFWIAPRAFTDSILPIAITPQPTKLERVIVGRTEVMTPAFETTLLRDFALDSGKRWENDRYFRAYRERVRQLRGTPYDNGAKVSATGVR
jgi:hypothetical protein